MFCWKNTRTREGGREHTRAKHKDTLMHNALTTLQKCGRRSTLEFPLSFEWKSLRGQSHHAVAFSSEREWTASVRCGFVILDVPGGQAKARILRHPFIVYPCFPLSCPCSNKINKYDHQGLIGYMRSSLSCKKQRKFLTCIQFRLCKSCMQLNPRFYTIYTVETQTQVAEWHPLNMKRMQFNLTDAERSSFVTVNPIVVSTNEIPAIKLQLKKYQNSRFGFMFWWMRPKEIPFSPHRRVPQKNPFFLFP